MLTPGAGVLTTSSGQRAEVRSFGDLHAPDMSQSIAKMGARSSTPVPRVMLYAHDASGFGHLRRVSRLAAGLQGECACLILTGSREAAWLVDHSCEFVKLPSWESVFRSPGSLNTGGLWLDLSKDEARRFRSDLIVQLVSVVAPAAFIVDYLPLGLRNELLTTLRTIQSRKYLLLRGVIDSVDAELRALLASEAIAALYDRLFVAADKRVSDVINDLPLSDSARAKCDWVGYITHVQNEVETLKGSATHVVCSAGSGLRGEALFAECFRAALHYPEVLFDIVLGPRCTLSVQVQESVPANVRVSRVRPDLPDLHATADVVITSGGYNSLLEAAGGGAEIIVSPVNSGPKDEQVRHARAFQMFYPIMVADTPSDVRSLLGPAIAAARQGRRRRLTLAVDGVARIRHLILGDLGIEVDLEETRTATRRLAYP